MSGVVVWHEVRDPLPDPWELWASLSFIMLSRQAMLMVHDTVAQKNFDPVLPPLPDNIDEDFEEESVKIVRLVKNKEPLVCGALPLPPSPIPSGKLGRDPPEVFGMRDGVVWLSPVPAALLCAGHPFPWVDTASLRGGQAPLCK